MGRDVFGGVYGYLDVTFQSTRPRGARHAFQMATCGRSNVSIHAPTWGATRISLILIPTMWFQSTRPRGARRACSISSARVPRFNPRAHVGRDRKRQLKSSARRVSIHAPTWGATSSVFSCLSSMGGFNPRAHVGRDSILDADTGLPGSFNPRAHVGRDLIRARSANQRQVSIHAPTWGATPRTSLPSRISTFQSTRPRGARHPDVREQAEKEVSIHAPTWGATHLAALMRYLSEVSIHAPTWGATCRLPSAHSA